MTGNGGEAGTDILSGICLRTNLASDSMLRLSSRRECRDFLISLKVLSSFFVAPMRPSLLPGDCLSVNCSKIFSAWFRFSRLSDRELNRASSFYSRSYLGANGYTGDEASWFQPR